MLQNLIILGLASATFSTTVAMSRLFKPMRGWVAARSEFFGELVGCAYCLGHWASLGLVLTALHGSIVELAIAWLAVTAISALASGVIGVLYGD